jgi:hypothetical protein
MDNSVIDYSNKKIIGYIHVCQVGHWKRSLKMLLDSIKNSGLYENTTVIRLGVLNDLGVVIQDEILNDEKLQIVYVGKSHEYEVPTLLHMREMSEKDDKNTLYYYLHTKGIKHFGNPNEPCVVDWINLLLYWNVEKWKLAVEKLETYDTYGCNDIGWHYSGNFWWANCAHILKLPNEIVMYHYTAPEDWVQRVRDNKCCIYNSGLQGNGHYVNLFPRTNYCLEK